MKLYLETERLIVRDLIPDDEHHLFEIKNDTQVMEYIPDYIKMNATLDDIRAHMSRSMAAASPFEYNKEYMMVLKSTGEVIGAIDSSRLEYLYELQLGWQVMGRFTRNGYASEAAAAVSDFLLKELSLDYMAVVMDTDNPASFRVAVKSGFRLFETRAPFDWHYSGLDGIDPTNYEAVRAYTMKKAACVGSNYFYFRKFNSKSTEKAKFYGDVKYEGRFA